MIVQYSYFEQNVLLVLFSVSAHSMCTHENNVPSCLLSKLLCGTCTCADDIWLPIAGINESMMTTLYIKAFQIRLRGGRWVSPRWGRQIIYFARRENFFNRAVGTWGGVILNNWLKLIDSCQYSPVWSHMFSVTSIFG